MQQESYCFIGWCEGRTITPYAFMGRC